MAQRPELGKCVHCLNDPVERDWDHVLPEAWYPDTTADGLPKWKAPSCIPCNKALEKIEKQFLRRVALGLDPNHPGSRGVIERTLRSMTPDAASTERERAHRAKHRQQILDAALTGDAIPRYAAYPGLGEKWLQEDALPIRVDLFRHITEKIVRGFTYVADQKFIEPPYGVTFMPPNDLTDIQDTLDQFGATHAREPGIVIRRALAEDDGTSSLLQIKLWGQLTMYAWVTRD